MDFEFLLNQQKQIFEKELKTLSDESLIEKFNKQVRCLGGNQVRSVFLEALRKEFQSRSFDSSLVLHKCGFRLQQKVRLENNSLQFQ